MKKSIRKVINDFRYKILTENRSGRIADQTTFSDLVIKVREVRPGIWESD